MGHYQNNITVDGLMRAWEQRIHKRQTGCRVAAYLTAINNIIPACSYLQNVMHVPEVDMVNNVSRYPRCYFMSPSHNSLEMRA